MPLVRRTLALWTLIALATVSPALAGQGRRHGPPSPPGSPGPSAPAVDCGPDTFTESSSMTPTDFNGVSCVDANDVHFANSWFRSFHLPDYGLLGQFFVCQVNLAIEFAAHDRRRRAADDGQPVHELRMPLSERNADADRKRDA